MSAPPKLELDAKARETLSSLLALRPQVWEDACAAAKGFDEVVYYVDWVLKSLRSQDEWRENNIARWLDRIDAGVRQCGRALAEAGESSTGARVAAAVAALTEPARDYLAGIWTRARVPGGRNAIVNLAPQDYLILCACCRNTAERVRLVSDSVCFSTCTDAVRAPCLPRELAQALFAKLERKGAAALCDQVEREGTGNVLSYCPECRALYCSDHYSAKSVWSGSWFEALYGTCPKGHHRELA